MLQTLFITVSQSFGNVVFDNTGFSSKGISFLTAHFHNITSGDKGDKGDKGDPGQGRVYDDFPDIAGFELGELIAVGEDFYRLGTTDASTPNLYQGTVGRSSITFGEEQWRGVATSQSPNGFRTEGGFSANPNNALVMILASNDRHIRVIVKKSVYESFKGSNFAATDTLHMTLALESGDSDVVTMGYYNLYMRDTDYLVFQHRKDSGNYNLYDEESGNNLGATFRVGDSTGTQFTHAVSVKHWLLWHNDPPELDGSRALEIAQANQARLDALDLQVDGSATPLHTVTYDEDTALLAPTAGNAGDFAISTTFNDIMHGDLLVFDWKKCEHLNDHSEHVLPGSNTDAGRMYVSVDSFNADEWDGEFIYAVDRAVQNNGSADTLNSWIVGSIEYSGTSLTFGLHLQQGGSRANRNLKPQAGFSLQMRVYRNADPTVATEGSIHSQIGDIKDILGDVSGFKFLTQTQYNALSNRGNNTVYFIRST